MMFEHTTLAYIGPGLGLGAIGSITAVLCSFFVMFLGFVFYPVKVFLKNFKKSRQKNVK